MINKKIVLCYISKVKEKSMQLAIGGAVKNSYKAKYLYNKPASLDFISKKILTILNKIEQILKITKK